MASGIGESLRAARERVGVTLADAAAETRIRETNLAALEDERFDRLGGEVYVKGFLRSYARFLGIDPEPLIEAYREEHASSPPVEQLTQEPVEAPPRGRRPVAVLVVAVALLFVGGLAVIGYLAPGDDEPADVAVPDPVPEEEEDDDEAEPDEGDEVAEADEEAEPAEDPDEEEAAEDDSEDDGPDPSEEIVLTLSVAGGESWVRVTVDGERVDEGTYTNGHEETYRGDEVVLRLGNPGPARLELNGDDLGQVGEPGQPINVTCSTELGDCEVGA